MRIVGMKLRKTLSSFWSISQQFSLLDKRLKIEKAHQTENEFPLENNAHRHRNLHIQGIYIKKRQCKRYPLEHSNNLHRQPWQIALFSIPFKKETTSTISSPWPSFFTLLLPFFQVKKSWLWKRIRFGPSSVKPQAFGFSRVSSVCMCPLKQMPPSFTHSLPKTTFHILWHGAIWLANWCVGTG